jgi:putative toxin-antitoxin system antitoxin component (TIGR02293 family)
MAVPAEHGKSVSETADIQKTANLLGGSRVLRRELRHPLEVHEVLSRGLPGQALVYVVSHTAVLNSQVLFERALGVSRRTSQRLKLTPNKPLSKEQSGRLWKFAEILAKATEVFGSQKEAERWLEQPAIGLEQRRPIDLLATPAGVKLIEDFLGRLEYGVYD